MARNDEPDSFHFLEPLKDFNVRLIGIRFLEFLMVTGRVGERLPTPPSQKVMSMLSVMGKNKWSA